MCLQSVKKQEPTVSAGGDCILAFYRCIVNCGLYYKTLYTLLVLTETENYIASFFALTIVANYGIMGND